MHQQPRYVKSTVLDLLSCFGCYSTLALGSTFVRRASNQQLDLGGYEAADGFYDLNEEPDGITNLGGFGRLGEYSAELYDECITLNREEWRRCKLLCESDYCRQICDREYEKGITYCKIEHNHPDVQD